MLSLLTLLCQQIVASRFGVRKDEAKIQIKIEIITPLGDFFLNIDAFDCF